MAMLSWLCNPSLPCAQYACHHEVGVIGSISPSFPPASSDDRSASQFYGFIQQIHYVPQPCGEYGGLVSGDSSVIEP
ncbi:hypothetical protein TNCV_3064941 [Trichonephila clavipes]|nr:hypothetical protein TNCV_3064941 [Trichonephila clavipes]